jgi:hypothetical protein
MQYGPIDRTSDLRPKATEGGEEQWRQTALLGFEGGMKGGRRCWEKFKGKVYTDSISFVNIW